MFFSAVINTIDTLSAVAILSKGYSALRLAFSQINVDAPRMISRVSYAIIVIAGIAHMAPHVFSHKHGEGCLHSHKPARNLHPWMLALCVGLLPSDFRIFVSVRSHSQYGRFALLPMSVTSPGGFISMSVLFSVVIRSRMSVDAVLAKDKYAIAATAVEWVGSTVIIGFGVLFFIATFG